MVLGKYTYKIEADTDEVDRALESLLNILSGDQLKYWMQTDLTEILRERARRRFDMEGDDASGGWLPLAESTLKNRKREGYAPGPINDRSGLMRSWVVNSIMAVSGSNGDLYATFPGRAPRAGKIDIKLRTAQLGRDDPIPVPARPVLATSGMDAELALRSLEDFIEREVGR